jgi:hypothetical protein
MHVTLKSSIMNMKIFWIFLFCLLPMCANAAITAAAGGGQWTAPTTWVGGVVPTATDDVILDGTSGSVTVGTNGVGKTLTCTGYTGTLTISDLKTLTISGSVVLVAGMGYAGTGTLKIDAAGNFDSGGLTITTSLTLGSFTTTFLSDVTVDGLLTQSLGDSGVWTASSAKVITCNSSLTISRKTTLTNVSIVLAGTGTWTGADASANRGIVGGSVTINTAGTITMVSPAIGTGTTATYTAGTISWGTSRLNLNGNCSLLGAWPAINGMIVNATTTLTIDNALTVTGAFQLDASLTMSGNYAVSVGTLTTSGDATLTRVNSWTIGVLQASQSDILTIAGAYDQIVRDFVVKWNGGLKFPPSQTLTVTGSVDMEGNVLNYTLTPTTVPNVIWFNYTGMVSSQKVSRVRMTNVDASGSSTPIFSMHSATLSSVTNVVVLPTPVDMVGVF